MAKAFVNWSQKLVVGSVRSRLAIYRFVHYFVLCSLLLLSFFLRLFISSIVVICGSTTAICMNGLNEAVVSRFSWKL